MTLSVLFSEFVHKNEGMYESEDCCGGQGCE